MKTILLALLALLTGCTHVVVPDRVTLDGQSYEISRPVAAEPSTDAQGAVYEQPASILLASQVEWDNSHTHTYPIWGCTAFDFGTTAFALLKGGFVESNPLGLLLIPISIAVNKAAEKRAREGDPNGAVTASATHCGAGALNVVTIIGAL
jgi:hypothetical protein